MVSKFDARQSEYVGTLGQVSPTANPQLDTVSLSFNNSVGAFYEDRNIFLAGGGTISYNTGSPSIMSMTAALVLYINSRVLGGAPLVINIGSASRSFSANGRMLYAVIDRTAGTAVITADAATLPTVNSANQEVFLIAKRIDLGTERLFIRNGQSMANGDNITLGASSGSTVFSDGVFQIYDDGDPTKIMMFQASGITTGTTRTFTVPDASTTLAGLSVAQTFSAEQTFSAQVRISNGTVTEPAIVFTADDDTSGTGIYRPAANQIGLAVNGVFTGLIAAQGYLNINGTALLPSYSFNSDPNTGMYGNGSDNIFFSTNGAQRLQISASTTTSSNVVLIDKGNTASNGLTVQTNATQEAEIVLARIAPGVSPSSWEMYLPTGSTDIRWYSSGDKAQLTALGQFKLPNGTAALPSFSFINDPNTGIYSPSNDANEISFSVNGTLRGNVNPSGFRATDGTEALPAYSFLGTTGMGMWRSTSAILGFSTGGLERFSMSSSGLQWYEGGTGEGFWKVKVFSGSYTGSNISIVLSIPGSGQLWAVIGTQVSNILTNRTTIQTGIDRAAPLYFTSTGGSANSIHLTGDFGNDDGVSGSYRIIAFYI